MRQQRLLPRLRPLRERVPPWPSAVATKLRALSVSEERDARGMAAVAHGQRAAGAGRVRLISERRLRAEGRCPADADNDRDQCSLRENVSFVIRSTHESLFLPMFPQPPDPSRHR
jgi:hypothetical protein